MIPAIRRQLAATAAELRGIRGNARACLFMEPLWGVPFNLFATYVSVYMVELGCTNLQVGLVASIGLACNMVFSLPAGYITDRLGRRRTSVIFDLLSWSVATLIWATAGGYIAFVVAAVINSLVRVVHVSWSCLLIEGTEQAQRVHVYAWVNVAGLLAGFVAPLAGLLVARFGVVGSMRGMYLFAFASMTTMFFVRNAMTTETPVARARAETVRHWKLPEILADYRRVAKEIMRSPLAVVAFALAVLLAGQNTLRGTFTAILLVQDLGFPAGTIALFPALSAAVMLGVYLFWLPALSKRHPVGPLVGALAAMVGSSVLLAVAPRSGYLVVIAATVLGALGTSIAAPFADALLANSIRDEDRATSLSIVYTLLFGLTAPFGYLGGLLAERSARLPLVLAGALALVAAVLALAIPRKHMREG